MNRQVMLLITLMMAVLLSSCGGNDTVSDADAADSEEIKIQVETLAAGGSFERPIGLVHSVEGSTLYIIEQAGRILTIDPSNPEQSAEVFLDIRDRVDDGGSEQGLLGLAFHPNYQDNGTLYVNYTAGGQTLIAEYTKDSQQPYAIPDDNPFISQNGAMPEIYAYGLRNPWRFSFDSETDELWAADVGQNQIEEINQIDKGQNYGWNIREGSTCYKPEEDCDTTGLVDPIWEYDHSQGRSITGGYVYRGSEIPELAGYYIYGDFVSGNIWRLKINSDGSVDNQLLLDTDIPITSFGTDAKGELYITSYDGGIYRLAK
jgi:glucose/arabinose dehydrogenase